MHLQKNNCTAQYFKYCICFVFKNRRNFALIENDHNPKKNDPVE